MAKRTTKRQAAPSATEVPRLREPIEFTVSEDGSMTRVVFTGATGKSTVLTLDIDALGIAAVGFTSALRAAHQNFRNAAHRAARDRSHQRTLRS